MVPGGVYSVEPLEWDQFVAGHSQGHVLQSSAWGRLKSQFGWSDERVGLTWQNNLVAGAQVLYRRLPGGLGHLAYVPKGPLADWTAKEQVATLMGELDRAVQARGAIALTIEPDLTDRSRWCDGLRALGFAPSMFAAIQPRSTLIVDISPTEERILGAMKSKTRYNVRLAARKGVEVREAEETDLPAFHTLMAATAARDSFGVHTPAYYEAAYRLFVPQGWARLLLAETAGSPVAALMVFALPPRSWYFYGASGDDHREKMPTYLLQWEAMRWAKSVGCTTYDLWGIPDEDTETLEAEFTHRRGGLWGVYRFKRGFGGVLVRSVGAWDRVYAKLRYRLYRWMLELRDRVRGSEDSMQAGQG
jgi:peptidoglycan pentaglycine glycine transferase (the first glycine)